MSREDLIARVAAIAEREQSKTRVTRDQMREQNPGFAAAVDKFRAVFGQPHAVRISGARYGQAEMWFRRTQQHQPPIPGVTTYGRDSEFREGQPGRQSRKDRGVSRAGSNKGDGGAAGARPWWAFDDDGGEEGREV